MSYVPVFGDPADRNLVDLDGIRPFESIDEVIDAMSAWMECATRS